MDDRRLNERTDRIFTQMRGGGLKRRRVRREKIIFNETINVLNNEIKKLL